MHQLDNHLSANSAFTLIELLVAMAVASIMMAVIATAFWQQTQSSRRQQAVVEMQQNMRSAMYFMERDIKMAGYDGDVNSPPSATITTADSDEFSFTYVDDGGASHTVTYDLYDANSDGDDDIGRKLDSLQKAAIAQNIQDLEFFYTLADGRQAADPSALSPPGLPEDVRVVGITILARTALKTEAGTSNRTYTSLSGQVSGPFNDRYQRQLLTATILCRNMM